MASRQQVDDELYFRGNSNGEDSPTIEPLRINKPNSPSPPRSQTNSVASGSGRYNYPPPSKHIFPLPPGASSSAAPPLPHFPDDDEEPEFQYPRPPEPRKNRAPYPDDNQSSIPDKGERTSSPYSVNSTSSRQASNDPARPATGSRKASYDTNSRVGASPGDKRGARLGEKSGTVPKPLSESPGSDASDREGLFSREPQRTQNGKDPLEPSSSQHTALNQTSDKNSTNLPPALIAPKPMNRFSSTASTSTVRASRGSPAPPETPVELPGGDIEARFAAAGIAGTATLSSLQAQNAAAALRSNQYAPPPVPQLPMSPGLAPPQQQQQQNPARPWTPTESSDSQRYGPPTVYQGHDQLTGGNVSPPRTQPARAPSLNTHLNTLEQDYQRMQLSPSPPPAYSSVTTQAGSSNGVAGSAQGYPVEKQHTQAQAPTPAQAQAQAQTPIQANAQMQAQAWTQAQTQAQSSSQPEFLSQAQAQANAQKVDYSQPLASPALQHPGHPAFANDPSMAGTMSASHEQNNPVPQFANSSSFPIAGPASPPPMPEGWIAHLDQNSGQYYYIHLATQATQWEFPKGPTPLNVNDIPLSPTLSTYGNPLASPNYNMPYGKSAQSPMFPPHTPGYAESILSMTSQTPTAVGFSGPPPSAGVDMYKIAPTNSVYFGPYLKYINMDLERGVWLGSIMLVTDAPQPPTIHIHQSVDLSPNPRQLKANPIYTHQRWVFYRYDVDLQMGEGPGDKWTYAITSHLGCTRYEFLVAGRYETNWRFIAHSGNDFATSTNQNERSRLGGVGFMWKDILQKNVDCGGFHAQLGLGGQIYADRLWKEVPLLKQWLALSGKENRKNAQWTAKHEEDVAHSYFHYYTSHFDQPYLREAFAQIPHVLQLDDHDIFDGFGSYPATMQSSQMFKNIGRIGIEMYLLFQHHTTLELLRNVSNDVDLFTITGTGWHFVKYLGPAVVVVGPDTRSERSQTQVLAGPTYQGIFPKVAMLPPSVQHCIWMIPVPVIYPRLEVMESFANTVQTGKKAVNTTYNLVGKVTSSVAGIVGGKEVVQSGFSQVKKAVGKSGLMGGVLNSFGDVDIGDELRDMWTHESKDLERTYLIRTLQGIAHQKGLRMTFLSGQVNSCGAGLVHDPAHPSDHKTMYQVIASSVVASPPANMVLKMLHNNKPLYVPANEHKSTNTPSDTKEDMMEIFQADTNGTPREMKKLMGRRNYVAFIAYDPNEVPGMGGGVGGAMYAGSVHSGSQGLSKLSLAIDFVVQGDGAVSIPTKYGPVIVPSLEFGR